VFLELGCRIVENQDEWEEIARVHWGAHKWADWQGNDPPADLLNSNSHLDTNRSIR